MEKTLLDFNRRSVSIRKDDVEDVLPQYWQSDYPTLISFLENYYNFMDSSGEQNFGQELKNLYRNRDIEAASLKNLDQLLFEIGNRITSGDIFTDPRKAAKRLAKFYRKKGSSESIKEFFRLFFGEEIELSYPKNDRFVIGESNIGFESQKFIQDNALYQLYSILIQSPLSSSTWAEIYRDFVHPAGWYFQGQLEAVGLADVMEDSMPLSIPDTDVDPDIIGTAQMSLLGSPTIMTSLFDSAGNTVRSYIDHSAKLSAYSSLSLDSAQKLGYNKISKIIEPTSPTFDIDSDGSNAFGGIDFSNTFETLDQNIFKYDSV